MKTELYQKIFRRMDELGAIREDSSFGFKRPPILSDCLKPLNVSNQEFYERVEEGVGLLIIMWDYSKPFLQEQSNELGEKLLSLLI